MDRIVDNSSSLTNRVDVELLRAYGSHIYIFFVKLSKLHAIRIPILHSDLYEVGNLTNHYKIYLGIPKKRVFSKHRVYLNQIMCISTVEIERR